MFMCWRCCTDGIQTHDLNILWPWWAQSTNKRLIIKWKHNKRKFYFVICNVSKMIVECYQSTADYHKQPVVMYNSAYKKSFIHSRISAHTHTKRGSYKHFTERRRSTHMEFGHFIWAWWEKGRAWAEQERDTDVMSCERGIPHTKNKRLQSDIYCPAAFAVYVGSKFIWHRANRILLGAFIVM